MYMIVYVFIFCSGEASITFFYLRFFVLILSGDSTIQAFQFLCNLHGGKEPFCACQILIVFPDLASYTYIYIGQNLLGIVNSDIYKWIRTN